MDVVSDDFIEALFKGTRFGESVDNSTAAKRALIAKSLSNQIAGYWSGSTIYRIMVNGGFLHDAKSAEPKILTSLGQAFLREHHAQ